MASLSDERRLTGLTEREAVQRLAADGPNALPAEPPPGPARRVLQQLSDPFALLATIATSLALQVLMLVVPPLRSALRLEALPVRGWVLAAGSAAVAVAVIDVARAASRRRQRRATP